MFSQQTKAAKLAWLEGDQSKPTAPAAEQQVGRNLFDLYTHRSTSPVGRTQSPFERAPAAQNNGANNRDLDNQRTAAIRNYNQAQRASGGAPNQKRPTSQASSAANIITTSDDDDDDDLGPDEGSLRQLQKNIASASAKGSLKPKWPKLSGSEAQKSALSRRRRQLADQGEQQDGGLIVEKPSALVRLCSCTWRLVKIMSFIVVLNLLVYFWPIDPRLEFDGRIAPPKPRPKFAGPLAVNQHLDTLAEKLYENQFHAPESMAWTADKRAFFTGVEGGFILLVEPYADRWTVAARLNARHSVDDRSWRARFVGADAAAADNGTTAAGTAADNQDKPAPFCTRDVALYGARAEFEPSRVRLSRCSRPLGIRLAPDESRLYVADPFSGLYRIELVANLSRALAERTRPLHTRNRVIKLLDFKQSQEHDDDTSQADQRPTRPEQVYFGDDIAVDFGDSPNGDQDVVYMTDCSRRWPLRYLFWMMLENDDSGRVLRFDVGKSELSQMNEVLPVSLEQSSTGLPSASGLQQLQSADLSGASKTQLVLDERGLSFPNGLELTADKSGLLISDLNNRRILRHHLTGQRAGTTELVMWVPGYSDNIRRGLDEPDGTPTYWFACGCAVSDGEHEISEVFNEFPAIKRLLLRWLHVFGTGLNWLGRLLDCTSLKNAGMLVDAAWLKVDPYCTHGLVAQFNERGQILRSLHAPRFGSSYKLLSEAHQVPLLDDQADDNQRQPEGQHNQTRSPSTAAVRHYNNDNRSFLYLGSVYYSYLGRLELAAAGGPEQHAGASTPSGLP
jgi:hypothetical protein